MYFSTSIVSALLLAGSALAQTTSAVASTATGTVKMHIVKVSNKNGSLTYNPSNTIAAVGDMVQFQFYPVNHTVTQSTFANPCVPIHNVMSNTTGFFSGFMPVSASASTMPLFTMMVNSTTPIWFYCSQGEHCQKGMVGAINAPTTGAKTVAAFAALAAKAPANLYPGESSSSSSSSNSTSSSGSSGYGSGSGSSSAGAAATTESGSGSEATATSTATGTSSSSSTSPSTAPSGAAGSLFVGTKEVFTIAGGLAAFMAFVM